MSPAISCGDLRVRPDPAGLAVARASRVWMVAAVSSDAGISPTSRALTIEQAALLLEAVPAGPYRRYTAALVYTAMRAGKATAVRVRDADLDRGIIRVSRSFSPSPHGGLIEQIPKSHKDRDVPITQALRPHVIEAMKGKVPDELLFSGHSSLQVTERYSRAREGVARRAGSVLDAALQNFNGTNMAQKPDVPRL